MPTNLFCGGCIITDMKRIYFIASAIASIIAPTAVSTAALTTDKLLIAEAETNAYACITQENTYFYSSADENSGLFILPTTYYVKIISKSDDFCFVQYLDDVAEYKAVYGYCKTEDLTTVDFTPARPYLYYTYTATYTVNGTASTDIGDFSTFTCTCIYYGDYKNGTLTYRYVSINGEFGYIPKTCEIEYPLNTDYITEEPAEPSSSDIDGIAADDATDNVTETKTDTAIGSAGLGLIIALSAVLISIAVFVIAVKPRKKKEYSYDN